MGLLDELLMGQTQKRNLLMQGTSPRAGGQLTQMVARPSQPPLREQFPTTYGALAGLLGMEPDSMEGSILDPNTAAVRQGAGYGYPAGLALQALPMVAPAARLAGRGATELGKFVAPKAGQLAEGYMQRMGMMPSVVPVGKNIRAVGKDFPSSIANRSDVENAAEEGGGLLGDVPTAKASFKYPQQAALDLAQQRAAFPVEQGGLGLLANNTAEERAKAMGAIDWFHGTDRLDRLLEKKNIDARRATSGPMPYGTNEPTLASNYSMNKADTSRIASDMGEMQNYFQVFPKTMGERGTAPYSVEQIWNRLPQEKKAEILNKAKRVGFEDFDQSSGPLKLHPEGVNAMNVSEDTWNYYLNRESKGNPLTALRKLWGESGMLYNEEQKLADIYKLAGFPYEISQTNAPWTSAKGVMTGKAIISNPLDTSNVSEIQDKVIPFLKEQFKNDRTRTKAYGADQWDKNTRFTPKQWVDELKKDIESGENSYVWTSIPDKVTNALKKAGYNGIIDKSGKGGGPISNVIIPFEPEQIRSRFAAFDPWRKTAAIAATMGVAAPDLLAADLNEEELRKQMQSYGLLY